MVYESSICGTVGVGLTGRMAPLCLGLASALRLVTCSVIWLVCLYCLLGLLSRSLSRFYWFIFICILLGRLVRAHLAMSVGLSGPPCRGE